MKYILIALPLMMFCSSPVESEYDYLVDTLTVYVESPPKFRHVAKSWFEDDRVRTDFTITYVDSAEYTGVIYFILTLAQGSYQEDIIMPLVAPEGRWTYLRALGVWTIVSDGSFSRSEDLIVISGVDW